MNDKKLDIRLLERIKKWDEGIPGRGSASPKEIEHSIKEHIKDKLLLTWQGSAEIAEDYGKPVFNDDECLMGEEDQELNKQSIKSKIRRVLLKYEPRVRDAEVTLLHHIGPDQHYHIDAITITGEEISINSTTRRKDTTGSEDHNERD